MLSDWVSFLAYPNLFGIKGLVVVVVVVLLTQEGEGPTKPSKVNSV
jgi:flagellum-specific peptidoglycan hydrolase FlgJ